MTAWLVRRFVKNAKDVENREVRAAYGAMASTVGICVNLLLALAKFLLGLVSGSLAVTADAANNLSDAMGSVMSLVSVRLAKKPVDSEHPFGHGRMEYIGALAVGALVIVMGFSLLSDGIGAIQNPAPLTVTWVVWVILAVSVLAKLWLYFFYRKVGNTISSAPLRAAAKDSLSDVAATSAVLLSIVAQAAFGWQIDGYVGVLVALFVLKTGIDVCRETVDLLLGERPDPEKAKEIERQMLKHPGILGVHDVVLHDYGPGRCIATAHAEVSAKSDIVAVHEMIDKAERDIGKAMNVVLVLHMDPIVTGDPQTADVKEKLEAFLQRTDSRLSLHDFRMVKEPQQTRLVFDCALPDGYQGQEALLASLQTFVKTLDRHYVAEVQFDEGYL